MDQVADLGFLSEVQKTSPLSKNLNILKLCERSGQDHIGLTTKINNHIFCAGTWILYSTKILSSAMQS